MNLTRRSAPDDGHVMGESWGCVPVLRWADADIVAEFPIEVGLITVADRDRNLDPRLRIRASRLPKRSLEAPYPRVDFRRQPDRL